MLSTYMHIQSCEATDRTNKKTKYLSSTILSINAEDLLYQRHGYGYHQSTTHRTCQDVVMPMMDYVTSTLGLFIKAEAKETTPCIQCYRRLRSFYRRHFRRYDYNSKNVINRLPRNYNDGEYNRCLLCRYGYYGHYPGIIVTYGCDRSYYDEAQTN